MNEELRHKYTRICERVKGVLEDCKPFVGDDPMSQEIDDARREVDVLEEKYRNHPEKRQKPKKPGKYPETKEEIFESWSGEEEKSHSWSINPDMSLPNRGLFYRTWDRSSQCQILQEDFGLLSGGPDSRLDDAEGRKADL